MDKGVDLVVEDAEGTIVPDDVGGAAALLLKGTLGGDALSDHPVVPFSGKEALPLGGGRATDAYGGGKFGIQTGFKEQGDDDGARSVGGGGSCGRGFP